MDAAAPRHPSPPGGRAARRAAGPGLRPAVRRGVVPVLAALAADGLLWAADPAAFRALPAAYWVLAGLAVAVDARPYPPPGRRAAAVVLPSTCFTFAIVLAWGYLPALAAQLPAVAVAAAGGDRPARRAAHLAVQHAVALAAAAAVTAAGGAPAGAVPGWADALLVVAAAAAWIGARSAVAALAARGRSGGAPRRDRRRRAEVSAAAALLLLAPVVLTAARAAPVLVPLTLLALHAVHRTVRAAGESERARRLDALTGLPNRRALQAAVAAASGGRPALLVLDLDRFRAVNDALGHAAGDRLLAQVAGRLRAAVPGHDVVARLGGDEFAVLATRADGAAGARRVAAHLADTLARPFGVDGLPVEVSASVGIAVHRGGDPAALLRDAEAALYDARRRGDRLAVAAAGAGTAAPERLALPAELRAALRRPDGGVQVFYQPQVAVATGEVVGVEALLRWRHPRRGPVGPQELIRAVEPTPVMRELTDRVLRDVVAQVAAWRDAGRPLRAAVNVSVRDLHTGDLPDRVAQLLARHGVPASLLQLEITESALTTDPHRVLAATTRLHRMGVAVSLDDFGTGYSSLQHLRRLPLAEVKIDRSFVLGMATEPGDAAIVRSVVDLGAALGLRVVAEGVEDERTWRLLAAAGCHAAQGWFHARPMPAADLAGWLDRYRPPRPALPAAAPGGG